MIVLKKDCRYVSLYEGGTAEGINSILIETKRVGIRLTRNLTAISRIRDIDDTTITTLLFSVLLNMLRETRIWGREPERGIHGDTVAIPERWLGRSSNG